MTAIDGQTHYRLANDYGVAWPFWSAEGLCADGDPVLPAWLDAEVRAWAEDFNANYSPESGWPTANAAGDHRDRAQALILRVKRFVEADGGTVELRNWATDHA